VRSAVARRLWPLLFSESPSPPSEERPSSSRLFVAPEYSVPSDWIEASSSGASGSESSPKPAIILRSIRGSGGHEPHYVRGIGFPNASFPLLPVKSVLNLLPSV